MKPSQLLQASKKRFQFEKKFFLDPKPYDLISLYQIGDLSCNTGYVLREHKQVCYEISYIISGKGWFATNGSRYEVEAGDLYVNAPGEIHSGGADDKEPFRFVYLGFQFKQAAGGESPFLHIQKMMDAKETPRKKDRLDVLSPFINALKEFRTMERYSQMMSQTYLDQIIVLTYRNFFSDWESAYRIHQRARDGSQEAVYNAISYIDNNLLQMKDLTEVSDALGYSYSHLSHIVTEETGITLRDFYAQKKLQKAIELFQSREYTITEIASIMRYQSIHSFSRAFKNAVGLSPTEYIRLHCEK
ncbi:AraC family transcriptional regulator [Paenibacillus sp. MBLB4367]|uniref:AraC family transcriptional regulator n=1 Tax=Paenibacillus sp. MBLB4367 TaxID=3384767 RepID=UPI003907F599